MPRDITDTTQSMGEIEGRYIKENRDEFRIVLIFKGQVGTRLRSNRDVGRKPGEC